MGRDDIGTKWITTLGRSKIERTCREGPFGSPRMVKGVGLSIYTCLRSCSLAPFSFLIFRMCSFGAFVPLLLLRFDRHPVLDLSLVHTFGDALGIVISRTLNKVVHALGGSKRKLVSVLVAVLVLVLGQLGGLLRALSTSCRTRGDGETVFIYDRLDGSLLLGLSGGSCRGRGSSGCVGRRSSSPSTFSITTSSMTSSSVRHVSGEVPTGSRQTSTVHRRLTSDRCLAFGRLGGSGLLLDLSLGPGCSPIRSDLARLGFRLDARRGDFRLSPGRVRRCLGRRSSCARRYRPSVQVICHHAVPDKKGLTSRLLASRFTRTPV
jgi:hypothetical protein